MTDQMGLSTSELTCAAVFMLWNSRGGFTADELLCLLCFLFFLCLTGRRVRSVVVVARQADAG